MVVVFTMHNHLLRTSHKSALSISIILWENLIQPNSVGVEIFTVPNYGFRATKYSDSFLIIASGNSSHVPPQFEQF